MKLFKKFIFIFMILLVGISFVNAKEISIINIMEMPNIGFGPEGLSCAEIIGPNLVKILKSSFNLLRIVGAIIAIVSAIMALLPAVYSKDADALKKASNKCILMAIALVAIGIFPSIVNLITNLFGYDTTCLM